MIAVLSSALAGQTESQPSEKEMAKPVSDDEFKTQREFMIKDTEEKIRILQTAHDCAKASSTSPELAECNRQFRDAILGKKQK
jgi:hypothetical protein